MFAEVGEIIGGTKTLPKVPDCGKKFIMFKSLGKTQIYKELSIIILFIIVITGMAVEDVVSSKLVYDRYMEKQGQAKL